VIGGGGGAEEGRDERQELEAQHMQLAPASSRICSHQPPHCCTTYSPQTPPAHTPHNAPPHTHTTAPPPTHLQQRIRRRLAALSDQLQALQERRLVVAAPLQPAPRNLHHPLGDVPQRAAAERGAQAVDADLWVGWRGGLCVCVRGGGCRGDDKGVRSPPFVHPQRGERESASTLKPPTRTWHTTTPPSSPPPHL